MEHRWSMRRFLGGNVTVSHPRYGLLRATLRDISLGGMFIELNRVELPVNTSVAVSFVLQDGARTSHHRLHAMVVRSTANSAALMYLDSSADTIRPLRQMLYGLPEGPGGTAAGASPAWLGESSGTGGSDLPWRMH